MAYDAISASDLHLAPDKAPRHWRFVEELPLNASGKILKTELRARWSSD